MVGTPARMTWAWLSTAGMVRGIVPWRRRGEAIHEADERDDRQMGRRREDRQHQGRLMPSYRSIFRPDLFAGQTIIVTGGGSGLGRCTAHELKSLGARLALVGRTRSKLEAVREE